MDGDATFMNLSIVVTGAASGIGEATARMLSARGARVAAMDSNAEGLRALGIDLPGITVIPVDVSDSKAVHSAMEQAVSDLGHIDGLAILPGWMLIAPSRNE